MSTGKSVKAKPAAATGRRKLLQANGNDATGPRTVRAVSSEVRTIRVCIVAGLFAAVVLLFTEGEPALDIKVKQRARRDYVARVGFACEDLDEASRLRSLSSGKQPDCYQIQRQELDRQKADVLRTLRRVQMDSDVDRTVEALSEQGINVLEPGTFRQELLKLGAGIEALVDGFFAETAKWGVLSLQDYRNEIDHGRDEIAVLLSEKATPQLTKLSALLAMGHEAGVLDKAVAETFRGQSDIFRANVINTVSCHLRPTLKYDAEATERAREEAMAKVKAPLKTVAPDTVLLRRHRTAWPQHVYELQAERTAYAEEVRWSSSQFQALAGTALPLAVAFWCLAAYIRRWQRDLIASNARLAMVCLLCLLVLAIGHVLIRVGGPAVLTPVALASIIVSICHGERMGVLVSIILALAVCVMQDGATTVATILGLGGTTAAITSTKIDRRSTLIRIGLCTGVVQFLAFWSTEMLASSGPSRGAFDWAETLHWFESAATGSLWALGSGVAWGLAVSATLPVIEYLFDTTTDITLLELSDLNQPALRELMLNAPGTYHHSLMVGVLSEDAAKAVGGNPMLTRVGAYYHDIGKMIKPEYFVENVPRGVSQHTELAPQMSVLVITAHTKDGEKLAERYGLPFQVKDIITQHHGTTRVEYFYREALKESGAEYVEEDSFRYRGPKPQTKEAGIVMLADAIESASRVLSEPNPGRIEGLVDELVDRKLRDGQLDECDLTFQDISEIRKSVTRGLTATFHSRIKYPHGPEES